MFCFLTAEDEGDSDFDAQAEAATLGLDTTPAEFYDPEADAKDEKWVQKLRKGHQSDAILSCPLCFTTVCVDCQQHATNENQFRAMVDSRQIVRPAPGAAAGPPQSRRRRRQQPDAQENEPNAGQNNNTSESEQYNPVHCAVCDNEVGLREVGPSGVYHLFHVVASNS